MTKPRTEAGERWLTPGVRGIGAASFLADVGHEIPTALLPKLLTATLGARAAALGLIEGISDGLAGAAQLVGGAIADDPQRRRAQAVADYTTTAVLSSLIGAATTVWQVAILRAGAWAARGLRVPARNALLATHLSFREMAQRLYVSQHTVKTQAVSIYRKLGVASRNQAVQRVQDIGLLTG
jgi:Bacterial regulatory proteins, luxR family